MDDESETTNEWELPWEDVDACRKNRRLQKRHPVAAAHSLYLKTAPSCPKCGAPPDTLAWFYFESPDITWEHLCGRAGWMTVCDPCHVQVQFFLEAMS